MFQTRLGVPIQAAFWRIEYHGYSHLYGPMIFLTVALCIDRGVRRFEKAAILFARPATTIALTFESAAIPLAATGRGFIVRRRSKGETVALMAASHE